MKRYGLLLMGRSSWRGCTGIYIAELRNHFYPKKFILVKNGRGCAHRSTIFCVTDPRAEIILKK